MAGPAETRFWNVPNTLTMSRLVLAVGVFALIAYGQYLPALAVFGVASLTDALDGYFARLLNQDTPLGRQLDPLVDKVIVSGAYIYLLSIPKTGVQPWMVTTIVVREMLIQGLRSHLEGQGEAFGAKMAGKLKTLVQCISISAILLSLAVQPSNYSWILARDAVTWLAVALTVYSGLGYVVMAMPKVRTKSETTSVISREG
jgi:CDP-diacylglycerol--glycerol-3-phosphate 3-phosphatidyltransferase